jgi:Aldo/keto reductase family
MRKPMSVHSLEQLGRVRLSASFFMRDFLHSELADLRGIPNIPDDRDLAIAAGRRLCEELLEPLQAAPCYRAEPLDTTHAWQFARALGVSERHGWPRFVSMQNLVNLLYPEEEREILPLCAAEGIGVILWSPQARGQLTRDWNYTSI